MRNEEQGKKEPLESSKESNWVDEWNAGTITGIVMSSIFVFREICGYCEHYCLNGNSSMSFSTLPTARL